MFIITLTTMAKTVISLDQLQIQNKLYTSLALRARDTTLEERIETARNQGNTVDLENFGGGNDNEISCQIKEELLETFQTME